MRTFIAVEIPEKYRRVIWKLIEEHKDKNLPVKWVEFENLHITLKFIGEIDEKKLDSIFSVLSEVSNKTKRFSISLKNIGCFPGIRNPRVLWIGIGEGAEELIRLALEIENSLVRLGIKKEEKKFHPHLTIGRVKTFCNVENFLNQSIQTDKFEINEFVLFKSTLTPSGPIYGRLKTFTLV
ncbi:MAG: RNA 2',3'-cyclic phosphodiesterase [candidate division WOR-3 bacterium]|nr:RNA 2',3'-cyclic phosphodiesterase [candidate division WOR-3 bacterium]